MKVWAVVSIAVMLFASSGYAWSFSNTVVFITPTPDSNAVYVPSAERNLDVDTGSLQRTVYFHYKDKDIKKVNENSCSQTIDTKWYSTIDYIIDEELDSKDPGAFVASMQEWNDAINATLFDKNIISISDIGWDVAVPDGQNEIVLESYYDNDVIAATVVWSGIKNGNREIIESDIMFNDKFLWGNALNDKSVLDVRNVAMHELGHALGESDVSGMLCSDTTMFVHAKIGEIKKRTLTISDVVGVKKAYTV